MMQQRRPESLFLSPMGSSGIRRARQSVSQARSPHHRTFPADMLTELLGDEAAQGHTAQHRVTASLATTFVEEPVEAAATCAEAPSLCRSAEESLAAPDMDVEVPAGTSAEILSLAGIWRHPLNELPGMWDEPEAAPVQVSEPAALPALLPPCGLRRRNSDEGTGGLKRRRAALPAVPLFPERADDVADDASEPEEKEEKDSDDECAHGARDVQIETVAVAGVVVADSAPEPEEKEEKDSDTECTQDANDARMETAAVARGEALSLAGVQRESLQAMPERFLGSEAKPTQVHVPDSIALSDELPSLDLRWQNSSATSAGLRRRSSTCYPMPRSPESCSPMPMPLSPESSEEACVKAGDPAAAEAAAETPGTQNPMEWRAFTPSVINAELCMARTWNLGKGGQCSTRSAEGSDFCKQHSTCWEKHGRLDGPIPEGKLQEFRRVALLASKSADSHSSSSSTALNSLNSSLQSPVKGRSQAKVLARKNSRTSCVKSEEKFNSSLQSPVKTRRVPHTNSKKGGADKSVFERQVINLKTKDAVLSSPKSLRSKICSEGICDFLPTDIFS